jgi:biopolymer transport protein ExbB
MRVFDYIQQGGPVMYILVVLNIVGFAILFWKVFSVLEAKKNITATKDQLKSNLKGIKGFDDSAVGITLVKDEVQSFVHGLEAGLNTIKIIASIAPLLGLLGTVTGILSAFKVIADVGLSNPSLFAGGISMALLTTVAGLIVAIPHFVGYNYLIGALDDHEIQLEKEIVKELYVQN